MGGDLLETNGNVRNLTGLSDLSLFYFKIATSKLMLITRVKNKSFSRRFWYNTIINAFVYVNGIIIIIIILRGRSTPHFSNKIFVFSGA